MSKAQRFLVGACFGVCAGLVTAVLVAQAVENQVAVYAADAFVSFGGTLFLYFNLRGA